jgi:hypothetical protein
MKTLKVEDLELRRKASIIPYDGGPERKIWILELERGYKYQLQDTVQPYDRLIIGGAHYVIQKVTTYSNLESVEVSVRLMDW